MVNFSNTFTNANTDPYRYHYTNTVEQISFFKFLIILFQIIWFFFHFLHFATYVIKSCLLVNM